MLKDIRAFFDARAVTEVETPALSTAATSEVHLASWQAVTPSRPDHVYALHTSPELAMKRLLATGSGDIYQICKVFRADEQGRRHNPEFTLLEWYRVGIDMTALMHEVGQLFERLLSNLLQVPAETITYQQLFSAHISCDPLIATKDELANLYRQHTGNAMSANMDHQDWLDLIMSELIEPGLPRDRLVFVTHYPAAQASLAKLDDADPRVARRFEVFLNGMELANGFEELTDAAEQRDRMFKENAIRSQKGLPQVCLDEHFLAAMQAGLPACSGVAVGLDRLLMLIANKQHIDDVLTFSFTRI